MMPAGGNNSLGSGMLRVAAPSEKSKSRKSRRSRKPTESSFRKASIADEPVEISSSAAGEPNRIISMSSMRPVEEEKEGSEAQMDHYILNGTILRAENQQF